MLNELDGSGLWPANHETHSLTDKQGCPRPPVSLRSLIKSSMLTRKKCDQITHCEFFSCCYQRRKDSQREGFG